MPLTHYFFFSLCICLSSYTARIGNTLNWGMRIGLASDIAEGMSYLHSIKFIHRDLKSPNVLLTADAARQYGLVAKIADFGLTRHLIFTDDLYKFVL